MKITDVYNYFNHSWSRAMRELGFSRSAYSNWIKLGSIPESTQVRIELITQRKLKRGST